MVRLADGDRQAFDEVYRLAHQPVLALCRKLLAGHEHAEDLAQEALLKVFSGASRYDAERGPALPYILGGAGFAVRSYRKSMARQRARDAGPADQLQTPDPGTSAEDQLLNAELLSAVDQVVGQLSAADQQVLLLVATKGLTPTMRKRLSRALGRLRNQWSLQWT